MSRPEQLVFPFYADDPLYQERLLRERIEREILEQVAGDLKSEVVAILWREHIKPVVEEQIGQAIERHIDEKVQAVLDERILNATESLQAGVSQLFHAVDGLLDRDTPRPDPADWWKEGKRPPGVDDDDSDS